VKGWDTLEDGGSCRWLYAKEVSGLIFVFIEIDDLVDSCGGDADHRWAAQVSVVDLIQASPDVIASALRSCGWENDAVFDVKADGGWAGAINFDIRTEQGRLNLAECLHSYGARSPMYSEDAGPVIDRGWGPENPYDDSDPYFVRLRARCRRYAEENLFDKARREELLDTQIVNRIGQTAREYAQGMEGVWAALARVKEDPESATPEQKLTLRMYQKAGRTLGGDSVPPELLDEEESE
jgi:hypothetical protein